jgi:hypothetical protein
VAERSRYGVGGGLWLGRGRRRGLRVSVYLLEQSRVKARILYPNSPTLSEVDMERLETQAAPERILGRLYRGRGGG